MAQVHSTQFHAAYLRQKGGNVLAIYDDNGAALQQTEVPVYASGRIANYNRKSTSYQYELTDHLGNVRVVINENKTASGQADVVYYSDYYPFGSEMTLANSDYRYGYQGQFAEKDEETGWNNFQLRMYDPVIGRWMSTDPKKQYASPYVGMGNNPVMGVDPDGGYSWLGMMWRKAAFGGEWRKQQSGERAGEWYKFEHLETAKWDVALTNDHHLREVQIVGTKIFKDGWTPRVYVEAGAGLTEGGGFNFQASKALSVGFKANKFAIKDLGYKNDTENGLVRPNGRDATAFGGNFGAGVIGGSYDINKIYNKDGTFSIEQVIGVGFLGVFSGEVTLGPNGSFKGATLGLDVHPAAHLIYGAEAWAKVGWKWGK